MRKKNLLHKVLNFVSIFITVVCVLIVVALVGVRLVGLQPYVVLSGSMEPEYPVGSMIYVQAVNPENIQENDPITFSISETQAVTHRVVKIDIGAQQFITKGDMNDTVDSAPVLFTNLLGKPVFKIPLLGYFSDFISKPPGILVAAAVVILLLVVMLINTVKKKPEDKKANEDLEANSPQTDL